MHDFICIKQNSSEKTDISDNNAAGFWSPTNVVNKIQHIFVTTILLHTTKLALTFQF